MTTIKKCCNFITEDTEKKKGKKKINPKQTMDMLKLFQTFSFGKVNPYFLWLYRMENAAGHVFPVVFFSSSSSSMPYKGEGQQEPRMSPVQCCQDELHFSKHSKVKLGS